MFLDENLLNQQFFDKNFELDQIFFDQYFVLNFFYQLLFFYKNSLKIILR